MSVSDVLNVGETSSDVRRFVSEIKKDLLRKVVPSESPETLGTLGDDEENIQQMLDKQNAIVSHLKEQLRQALKKKGPCEEAVVREIRRELAQEVTKLEHMVDHIVMHNRVLHVKESFDLAQELSEENMEKSVFTPSSSGDLSRNDDYKNRMMNCLREKVEKLEKRVVEQKKAKKPPKVPKKSTKFSTASSEIDCQHLAKEMGKRERDVAMMEMGINRMSDKLKKMRDVCCAYKPQKRSPKAFETKNYSNVITNLARKNKEVQELSMQLRVKKFEEKPAAENAFLREMIQKMEGEMFTLKTIVQEQTNQLKVYQEKYINAQQLSEERHGLMRKMQQKSEQMEESIHSELLRIRKDFQRQIQELQQQNKKVTSANDRLKDECKKKRNVHEEMNRILPELERLQREEKLWLREKKKNFPEIIAELEEERQCFIYKLNQAMSQNDVLQEKLAKCEGELERLNVATVEIINRTNVAAEEINKSLRGEVAALEKDVAQCRAAAKIALADRDGCIMNLRAQITILEQQFQEAKLQIENVRGHITQVTDKVTGGTKTICKTCDQIL